jgi:hypothetical protein
MHRAWRQDKLAFCLVGIRKNDGIIYAEKSVK